MQLEVELIFNSVLSFYATSIDRYMAPEVFKHRKYDKKVDVFSFAMILYEVSFTLVMGYDILVIVETQVKDC